MPSVVPLVPGVPEYRISTVLAGQTYVLDLRWNASDSAWYMDLLSAQGAMIAPGLKLVLGTILARHAVDPLTRQGALVVADTSGRDREATLDDLGTRVQLRYYTVYDVMAALRRGRGL